MAYHGPKGTPPGQRQALALEALDACGGNLSAAARKLGISRQTMQKHVTRAGVRIKPLKAGRVGTVSVETRKPPRRGVRRYILTCAQNSTPVNAKVLDNLFALASHYGVADEDFLCSSFTYNQNAFGPLSVKRGTSKLRESQLWYDEAIRPMLDRSDKDIELAPGLVWCGRMNTLPTDSNPLAGFETYTGRKSGILPHAKLAMQSIATLKGEGTKFNYTTGTITQRNYIQKRAGLKAEFHHCYGALLVEVTPEGNWYVRQLNADNTGRIYDVDLKVEDGKVDSGNRVEAINWGDVHVAQLDPDVRRLAWAPDGMLDSLRPKHQFFHDLLDFRARNHHDRANPHRMFERFVEGGDDVAQEIRDAANFLIEASRPWCRGVVVDSNHDNALERWLREADYKNDPKNAVFFLESQLAKYRAIAEGNRNFHSVEHALGKAADLSKVKFLRPDESYIICRQYGGGIESGMHGHLGPDGARGSPSNLARMGRRANTGHTHSAGIKDGLYTAATCSLLDVGWNPGPSSWSHTQIVTYANGKRALYTMWAGDWRAR